MTKEVDVETLKFATGNAYNLGMEDGVKQGKIHVLKTLRVMMGKYGIDELPLEMVEAFEKELKND